MYDSLWKSFQKISGKIQSELAHYGDLNFQASKISYAAQDWMFSGAVTFIISFGFLRLLNQILRAKKPDSSYFMI